MRNWDNSFEATSLIKHIFVPRNEEVSNDQTNI